MKYRYLRFVLALLPMLLVGCQTHSPDMWRCTATDTAQMHWVQYSPTRVEAATIARDRCRTGKRRSDCYVSCIPPQTRWHCVAIDKAGHTWYWNSTNRNTAIRNARKLCVHNTTRGGCRVPEGNCSMT